MGNKEIARYPLLRNVFGDSREGMHLKKTRRLQYALCTLALTSLPRIGVGISIKHELKLMPGESAIPLRFEQATDGGLLAIMDEPPTVVKVEKGGELGWRYTEKTEGRARIRSAVALDNGGFVLCVEHRGGIKNRQELPSAIVKLDSAGRETFRLDSGHSGAIGAPIYSVSGCVRWGDGYAISANEETPPDGSKNPIDNRRSILIRLNSDFSIRWRKPIEAGGLPVGIPKGPRVLSDKKLLVLGANKLIIVDYQGVTIASTEVGVCTWLRTYKTDSRIRIACGNTEPPSAATIIEYSETLAPIKKVLLGHGNVGSAPVAQLESGTYLVLGGGDRGPEVQAYSSAGLVRDSYHFPNSYPKYTDSGGVADMVIAGPSSAAVLRVTNQDDSAPVLSWLSLK